MADMPIKLTDDPVFKRALRTRDVGEHGNFCRDDLAPGSARIETYDDGRSCFSFICPCGCGLAHNISIYTEGQPAHGWKWNGDRQRPTLTPSIQIMEGCRWHGHLIDGVFKSC